MLPTVDYLLVNITHTGIQTQSSLPTTLVVLPTNGGQGGGGARDRKCMGREIPMVAARERNREIYTTLHRILQLRKGKDIVIY